MIGIKNLIKRDSKLNNKIAKLYSTFISNNLIYPILGIVEMYIVKKVVGSDLLSISILGDQIFWILFNLFSFIPILVLPKISELYSSSHENLNELIENVVISLIIGLFLGLGLLLITNFFPNIILRFFMHSKKMDCKANNSTESVRFYYINLTKYLSIKSLLFPYYMLDSILISILKGLSNESTEVVQTALNCNVFFDLIYILLNPISVNYFGIDGSNYLNLIFENFKLVIFSYLFLNKMKIHNVKRWFNNQWYNSSIYIFLSKIWKNFYFYFSNGILIQSKNIIRKLVYLQVNNRIMELGNDSSLLSDHYMLCKVYDLGYIFFKSLNSVLSIILPQTSINENSESIVPQTHCTNILFNKMLLFGGMIGILEIIILQCISFFVEPINSQSHSISANITYLVLFTCILNGIYMLYETFFQIKKGNISHSSLSIFGSFILYSLIKFWKNLNDVWLSSLLISLIKIIIMQFIA